MKHHSVVFDTTIKSEQELMDLYGIEINPDGTVYDPCDYTEYSDLHSWAAAMDDDNDSGGLAKMQHKTDYYDE